MKTTTILAIVSSLLLMSCATPYQKRGTDSSGGHQFKRLSENTFAVGFSGNGFTQPKRASDFAMLRAAEVTLEHNYRYFSILGEEDRSSTELIHSGGTAYTTGTAYTYGGYGSYSGITTYTPSTTPVYKPGTMLTIRCYDRKPGGHAGQVYDAKQLRESMRAQYKLDS